MGKRTENLEFWEHMGWEEHLSLTEGEAAHTSKGKKSNSLIASCRQADIQTQKHRTHQAWQFLEKTNVISAHSPSFFLQASIAEHSLGRHEISLWPVWFSCPVCISSQLLVHSEFLTGRAMWGQMTFQPHRLHRRKDKNRQYCPRSSWYSEVHKDVDPWYWHICYISLSFSFTKYL